MEEESIAQVSSTTKGVKSLSKVYFGSTGVKSLDDLVEIEKHMSSEEELHAAKYLMDHVLNGVPDRYIDVMNNNIFHEKTPKVYNTPSGVKFLHKVSSSSSVKSHGEITGSYVKNSLNCRGDIYLLAPH